MTGNPAKVNGKIGGKFTAWDGYIFGTTLELIPDQFIVQAWRTSEFSDDAPDSLLELSLKEARGGTKVTLTHSRIPSGQEDSYRQGWRILLQTNEGIFQKVVELGEFRIQFFT